MNPEISIIKTWCKNKPKYNLDTHMPDFSSITCKKIELKTKVYVEEESNSESTYAKWMVKAEPYMKKYPLMKESCVRLFVKHGESPKVFHTYSAYINGCHWSIDSPLPIIDETKPIEIALCIGYFCYWEYPVLGWIDSIFDTNTRIVNKKYELIYLEYVITPNK